MANELEEVTSCIKSLVTQHGGEMNIRQLSDDYMQLVGKEIPYRQLKHPSLVAFLKSMPRVLKTWEMQGSLYLSLATVSGSDSGLVDIQCMVACQDNRKKVHRRSQPFLGRGGSSFRGGNRGRRPRFPSKRPLLSQPPGSSLRSPYYSKLGMPNMKQQNPRPPPQQVPAAKPGNHPTFGFNKPSNQTTSTRPMQPRTSSPQPLLFGFSQPLLPTPPLPQSLNFLIKSQPMGPILTMSQPMGPNVIKSQPMGPKVTKPQPLLPHMTKPQPSILNVKMNKLKPQATPAEVLKCAKKDSKRAEGKGSEPTQTYKQQLEEEVQKKLPGHKPVFRVMTWGKKNKTWLATVMIGKATVSSYPEELPTSEAAEEYVSKSALKILQELAQELGQQALPVTSSADLYTTRVRQLVESTSNGKVPLWETKVEELYREAHKERLPGEWVKEVQERAEEVGLVVEMPCDHRYTLRLLQPATPTPEPSTPPFLQDIERPPSETGYSVDDNNSSRDGNGYISDHSSLTTSEGTEGAVEEEEEAEGGAASGEVGDSRLPPLTLPPRPYWDVFIMYIEDTNAIFLRFIGEEYSTAYDDLLTELELHYMEEKNLSPVEAPALGGLYAASHEESWFRVKVLEVRDKDVNVFFVDHGDAEVLELTNLHHLQDRFLALPAQSIQCCLSGLEYARSDPSALVLLHTLALGQTLVAEVVESGRGSSGASQPLVLYNTSGEDDVNINEKISEHLANNFPEPTLPPVGGVAEVYLMQVNSSGDVFVQVESSTFRLLDNLLHLARNRTEEMLGEGVEIDLTRLYLARFSQDGEWYRTAPRRTLDPNGKVLMYFVDFGNCERVPLSNVRALPSHDDQLSKIPHQALRCRLHKVPVTPGFQWTPRACKRLADLTPDDYPLLLKVQEAGVNGGPPLVELFKRLQPQNELVSLNATLGLDTSLFSDGDSNNNSVEKDIVLSPTRLRSRQSSSTSQSSSSQGFSSGPSSLNSPPGSVPASPCPGNSLASLAPPSQMIPLVGDYYDVVITYAASPSNFAVQSWKLSKQLSQLQTNMQTYYETLSSNSKAPSKITVKEYYAVRHNDGIWYRVYVNMVQQNIVAGLFVDYGDCFVTSSDVVRPLEPQFCQLSCQAIKAKLHGIEPANKDWAMDDSRRFQRLVEYREFVSAVMGQEKTEDGSIQLSLVLIDTTDKNFDVYIDQILVDEDRAVRRARDEGRRVRRN